MLIVFCPAVANSSCTEQQQPPELSADGPCSQHTAVRLGWWVDVGKRDFKRKKIELSEKPPRYPQTERDTSLASSLILHQLLLLQGQYFTCPLLHTQSKSEEPAQDFIHHCLSITEAKLISHEDANSTPPAVPSVPQTLWIQRSRSIAPQLLCCSALPPFLINEHSVAWKPATSTCSTVLMLKLFINASETYVSHPKFAPRFSKVNIERISSAPSAQHQGRDPYSRLTQMRTEMNESGPGVQQWYHQHATSGHGMPHVKDAKGTHTQPLLGNGFGRRDGK